MGGLGLCGKMEVLPGFEPGSLDSKSRVLTNYTIRPLVVVGAAVSVAHDMPSWLSWQSARLLTDRSLVRAQVRAFLAGGSACEPVRVRSPGSPSSFDHTMVRTS